MKSAGGIALIALRISVREPLNAGIPNSLKEHKASQRNIRCSIFAVHV
jgi:hypothetical protein